MNAYWIPQRENVEASILYIFSIKVPSLNSPTIINNILGAGVKYTMNNTVETNPESSQFYICGGLYDYSFPKNAG